MRRARHCDLFFGKAKGVRRTACDHRHRLKRFCGGAEIRHRFRLANGKERVAIAVNYYEVAAMDRFDRFTPDYLRQYFCLHLIFSGPIGEFGLLSLVYAEAVSISRAFSRAASVIFSPASILAISSTRSASSSSLIEILVARLPIDFST